MRNFFSRTVLFLFVEALIKKTRLFTLLSLFCSESIHFAFHFIVFILTLNPDFLTFGRKLLDHVIEVIWHRRSIDFVDFADFHRFCRFPSTVSILIFELIARAAPTLAIFGLFLLLLEEIRTLKKNNFSALTHYINRDIIHTPDKNSPNLNFHQSVCT